MMFNRLFNKLTAIFMLIILLSFFIAGSLVYFMLTARVLDDTKSYLGNSAESISRAYYTLINQQTVIAGLTDNPATNIFQIYINDMANSTNSLIWIVDKSGNVMYNSKDSALAQAAQIQDIITLTNFTVGYYKLKDVRQYETILSGTTPTVELVGNFYGAFLGTGVDWLTVQKPIVYEYNDQTNILGAVMIHTPIAEIYRPSMKVFTYYIISFAVAIIISATWLYFITRQITYPLNRMNRMAKSIALGDFSEMVDVKSKDEIGQLEKSINEMAYSLKNIESNRRDFIANVSHELKTPITSIKGFIGGIIDGTIPPDKHLKYLETVNDEISRLNRLVNDLLDLSRMESGETPLILKKIDINEMILRCAVKFENQIEDKGIDLALRPEKDQLMVSADSDAIERVLINILHNAIKFTQKGGKITITTKSQKEKVIVSIKDTGIGMSKEELHHMWDRFYKTDKSRSQDKKGTGLGLSIVKNIIKAHNQDIWVESEPGKGTVLTFTLDKL